MKSKVFFLAIIVGMLVLALSHCKKDPLDVSDDYQPTPYNIDIPKYFPTQLIIPEDNPMTVEGVELGRYLFYEGRIAGRTDTLMSCGTCHFQQYAFENGTGFGYGVTGIKTPHVMLPLFNLVWNPNNILWNGKVKWLEDLTWMGIHAPHEMKSDTNRAKALLQSIPFYPPLFKKAFGSDIITAKNMGRAIAQFMRSMVSANSKFDQWLRGETSLTASEMSGYNIFNTETGDCFHCHGTILFTTNLFYNNAKDSIFNDSTSLKDRYSITHDPQDIGAFRAPSLRNAELTGPYMHDGRFATLTDVINFYSEGLIWSPYVHPFMKKVNDGGIQLTLQQKADLLAFLKTLTDQTFINNPDYISPF
ncbi:MAG: cytochrome c peroxidase [Bacteroidota bacterium]